MKHFISVVTACAALGSCSQPGSEKELNVNVAIEGVSEAALAKLIVPLEEGVKTLDSALVKGGTVTLSADLDQPQAVYVQIDGVRQPVLIFAQQGDLNVTGNAGSTTLTYSVEGGEFTTSTKELKEIDEAFDQESDILNSRYEIAVQTNDTAAQQSLRAEYEEAYYNRLDKIEQLATKSGPFGAWLTHRFLADMETKKLDSIFQFVSVSHPEAPDVIKLKEYIAVLKRVDIGQPYVDFAQSDTAGNLIKVSDNMSRFTLLDFWASWCRPCRQENPNVVAAYNKYKDKGFGVIGISLDGNQQDWIAAIRQDGLTWPHMSDLKHWQNEAAATYGIRSIPQNVMVDDRGIIVAKNLREEKLHEWLAGHL